MDARDVQYRRDGAYTVGSCGVFLVRGREEEKADRSVECEFGSRQRVRSNLIFESVDVDSISWFEREVVRVGCEERDVYTRKGDDEQP